VHNSTESASPGTTLFSPQSLEEFRRDDGGAAKAIVGLMVGIFALGLVGYLCIAYWVSAG